MLDYPIHLAWGYLFLAGYIARVSFTCVRLPGTVGVFLVGAVFANFMHPRILGSRDDLQVLAFFLVLLNAGFEVSFRNLRISVLRMAMLPALMELMGVALYARLCLDFDGCEGLVLACVLFPLGEGLVIPKMRDFRARFPHHPLPQLVLTWAPLEATLALTLFGFLQGVSGAKGRTWPGVGTLLVDIAVRLAATVTVGVLVGKATGWALSRIRVARVRGKQVFTGTPVEGFLLVVGIALTAFGLGEVIPIGLVEGNKLFNSELLVIVTGSSFAHFADPAVLHGIEVYVAGIWVFGSIVLFSMLGSRTDITIFADLPSVLPVMIVGLVFRFLGVLLAGFMSPQARQKRRRLAVAELLFCFLSSLPRATIQGALGSVALLEEFFDYDAEGRTFTRRFINSSAKLYIVCFAIFGSLLLEAFGPVLLRVTDPVPTPGADAKREQHEVRRREERSGGRAEAGGSVRQVQEGPQTRERDYSPGTSSGEDYLEQERDVHSWWMQEEQTPDEWEHRVNSFIYQEETS